MKYIFTFVLIIVSTLVVRAQEVVTVEETRDAGYLLNTIFRRDSCFELRFDEDTAIQGFWGVASNNQGFNSQSGVFRNGMASVGIDSGIIVSTGFIRDAPGPNGPMEAADAWTSLFPQNGTDEDADALQPNEDIFDIASIEFEFIPTTDTITFNYVFFSEQYCQTLNSGAAADAFGFILTRPDGTKENIARLPISGDIVSPFTLKPGSPDEDFFLHNTTDEHGSPCFPEDAPANRYQGIAYDGFSTVLQAKGAVIPCGVHKLRIIVLDSRDGVADSGVLLEAGSFLAGLVNKPEPKTTAEVPELTPVEGCDTALITFTRRTLDEPFINQPLVVKYNVIPFNGPENEATRGFSDGDPGADYILPESPFIIPPGDSSATLRIPILADANFNEGREAFIVRYDGTCDCSENADTFYIQDNVDFSVDLGPDQAACANEAIDLTAVPLGGSGVYTYNWSTGATTESITYLSTGQDSTITVELTDECGLTGRDTVFISAPNVSANVDSFYSLCQNPVAEVLVDVEGGTRYEIVLEVDSGGVTTQQAYVITGDTTFEFTQTANIRVASVEDENGCGGATIGTAFVRSNEVDLTADVQQPDCPGDAGSIAITTAQGNLDFFFRWQDDATALSPTRDQLAPGEYIVEITPLIDPTCIDRDTFLILPPPVLRLDSITYDSARCAGEEIDLIPHVSGGQPPYAFDWNASASSDSILRITTARQARMFMLRVTDDCGNSSADTVITIEDPNPFALALTNEPASCQQDSIALIPILTGGRPPFTYDWNDGDGSDSLYVIRTVGGTTRYPFSVTDDCGLTLRDTLELTFSDTRAEVSGFYSVCNPPFSTEVPITLTGTGPFVFTVQFNGTQRRLRTLGDTTLTFTSATTVQLLDVRGGDGCPGTAGGIANVTDGSFAVVPTITPADCRGAASGSIELDVNDGNSDVFDYQWSVAGLSGPSVFDLPAGTYSVTITDQTPDACSFDTSFVVAEPDFGISLVIDTLMDVTCRSNGAAGALYTGGTGELTYEWSNGASGRLIEDIPAGLYELTVTDESGCSVVQPFTITDARREVQASIGASAVELSCDVEQVTLTAAQNTVPVDFSWTNDSGVEIGQERRLTITAPGDYTVEVTDPATGCSARDTLTIGQSDDVLTVNLPAVHALTCVVDAVDLVAEIENFSGPVTYEWRLNGGSPLSTSNSLTGIDTPGTYELTATRTDNGCTSTVSTNVVVQRDDPVVTVPNTTISSNCRSPEVTLVVNGAPEYSYRWSTTNGNLTGALDTPTTTADRPATYSVLVTDTLTGCTTTATVTVVQNGETLAANAGDDLPLVCNGTGTVLQAGFSPALNGTTVRWYAPAGNVLSTNLQAFTFREGPHVLEVIHPGTGCSSFDTVNVISEAPTAVTYDLRQPPCPEVGGSLLVTNVEGRNGPFTFTSPTGESDPFGGGLRRLPEGSGVLIVTDRFGCQLRDSFLIFDTGEFTGEARDVNIRLGESANLGVSTNREEGEILSYNWTNLPDSSACLLCPDPETAPLESYVAAVTVIDTNGCELRLRQQVLVEEPEFLYLPTAFSPGNGDGVNDIYVVFGKSEFVRAIDLFHVYDRWGNRVFTAENFPVNDPNVGWDGTGPNGEPAPAGAYVYVIKYQRFDNVPAVVKGDFILMR